MRGRVLILIGAIILLVVVLVFVLTTNDDNGEEGASTTGGETAQTEQTTPVPNPAVTPQAQDLVEIVIAFQDLPRGITIPADGVGTQLWPRESLPEEGNYFPADEIGDVIGRIARTDIVRGAPVLQRQVVDNLYEISRVGSDAAAIMNALPADRQWRAVSLPLDPTGIGQVAYGLHAGDSVDVIVSFLYVDVDPEFQTRLPNTISLITRIVQGEQTVGEPITSLDFGEPRVGRPEPSTLSPQGILVGPSEPAQRPRLVTQFTVQNAWVVHVGYFPPDGNILGATPTSMMATLAPEPGEGEAQQQQQAVTPAPTATPYVPLIITLAVQPQDALVLTWAVDSQVPITLALRAAGDDRLAVTDPVSLDYMIRTFNAAPPEALEFSLEPPITSIRRFDVSTLYHFVAGNAVGQ